MLDYAGELRISDGQFTEIKGNQHNYNTGGNTINTNSNNNNSNNQTNSNNSFPWGYNRPYNVHQPYARAVDSLPHAAIPSYDAHWNTPPKDRKGAHRGQRNILPHGVVPDVRQTAGTPELLRIMRTSQSGSPGAVSELDLLMSRGFSFLEALEILTSQGCPPIEEGEPEIQLAPQLYQNTLTAQGALPTYNNPLLSEGAPTTGATRFKSKNPFARITTSIL